MNSCVSIYNECKSLIERFDNFDKSVVITAYTKYDDEYDPYIPVSRIVVSKDNDYGCNYLLSDCPNKVSIDDILKSIKYLNLFNFFRGFPKVDIKPKTLYKERHYQ